MGDSISELHYGLHSLLSPSKLLVTFFDQTHL